MPNHLNYFVFEVVDTQSFSPPCFVRRISRKKCWVPVPGSSSSIFIMVGAHFRSTPRKKLSKLDPSMLNSKTKTKYALKWKHHYPWSYWNHRSEYHRWKYCHGHLQNDGGVLVESVWIFHSLDEFLCNQIQGIGPVWRDIFLHGPSDSERNNDIFIKLLHALNFNDWKSGKNCGL